VKKGGGKIISEGNENRLLENTLLLVNGDMCIHAS
jgi:hypothetical protein